MDTRGVDFMQFYARLGGSENENCAGVDQPQESVLVEYSNNGGITWNVLKELQGADYHTPR